MMINAKAVLVLMVAVAWTLSTVFSAIVWKVSLANTVKKVGVSSDITSYGGRIVPRGG